MKFLNQSLGLYTDMYQLTMMQSYLCEGIQNHQAAFDYFFRKIPYEGGFVVFAGLSEMLQTLSELKFSNDDIDYLHSLKMHDEFLDYLRSFSFKGTISSVEEGTIVFPYEPLVTFKGNLAELQLAETLMLNILNFNSLIATKAARVRLAAPGKVLSDFGLRRSQGYGGIQASRAAIIGGFDTTSNVFAARNYNLVPSGTMAHSYIQSFDDELTAFRKYYESHPDNCVLLVDTYNTLKSGIPNAIIAAKELEQRGFKLRAIRLDSGDLAYLAKEARKMLDSEGLSYVKIAVSNQLDEHIVKSLLDEQQAPIDFFGVGTNLVTGQPDAALDGIFKLAMFDNIPRLKISESLSKTTLPGLKKIIRYVDQKGDIQADAIALQDETAIDVMFHPYDKEKSFRVSEYEHVVLNKIIMTNGELKIKPELPQEIRTRVLENLTHLPGDYKRFVNPHIYKVGISKKLMYLRDKLKSEHYSN